MIATWLLVWLGSSISPCFLEHDGDLEVSDCVYFASSNNKHYIIAVGWDQRVNIFNDESDDVHIIQKPHQHWPDDLVSFMSTN